METIGASMRRARKKSGWSVKELASASGVSTGTIYSAEQGRCYPSVLVAVSCAEALGISLDEYIGREVAVSGIGKKGVVYGVHSSVSGVRKTEGRLP